MPGALRARGEYTLIIQKAFWMKAAMYGRVREEGMIKVEHLVFQLHLITIITYEKSEDAQGLFQEDMYTLLTFKRM